MSTKTIRKQVEQIAIQVYDGNLSVNEALDKLDQIDDRDIPLYNVRTPNARLVEELFKLTDTESEKQLQKLEDILYEFLQLVSNMRNLLDEMGVATLANMVLWSRGRLRCDIDTEKKLERMLEFWEFIGLLEITKIEILEEILDRDYIQMRINRGEWGIKSRLKTVFNSILKHDPLYKEVPVIEQSFFIYENINEMSRMEKMQKIENIDDLIMISPNQSYSVLKKFIIDIYPSCLLCDNKEHLQVHHIYPRSEGGNDFHGNLSVLCRTCHNQVHLDGNWP